MPKNRKTRKQKIRASIKQSAQPTVAQSSSSQQQIKLPEKFSLQPSFIQGTLGAMQSHAYLKGELLKTSFLSLAIIIAELIFYILIRNHLIVLPSVTY